MKKISKSLLSLVSLLAISYGVVSCGGPSGVSSSQSGTQTSSTPGSSSTTTPNSSSTPAPEPSSPSDSSSSSTEEEKRGTVVLAFDDDKGSVVADKYEGKVGETIKITVLAGEGYEIGSVKANGVELSAPYSFVLVEGSNSVEVQFNEVAPAKYTISVSQSEDYSVTNLSATEAEEGTKVTFSITLADADKKEIESVQANGVDCVLEDGKYSFSMPAGNVLISVTLKSKPVVTYTLSVSSSLSEYLEGAPNGAALLTAEIDNDGISKATDWAWDTSELNNVGVLNELPDDHPSKSDYTRFFTATNPGNGKIKVSCVIDGTKIEYTLDITVNVNYASYKTISTADELVELLSKTGDIKEKYCLGANIDLGGRIVNGRINESNFLGVLDGRGYTISNFTVKNASEAEADKATGLFHLFKGTLKNIHIKGTIDSAGFSGLLAKEVSGEAKITDCVFEATNVQTAADWTWCRNGVIASTFQGNAYVENVVSNLDAGSTGATCFPFFAYSWHNTQVMKNCYTNIAHDDQYENYKPFNPDGTADISAQQITNINCVDYSACTAEDFPTLDTSIWTIADGKMPVLEHDAEAPVTFKASIEANASVTSLSLKDGGTKNATITASLKNISGEATYSFVCDPSNDSIIKVTNNADGTFSVEAVGEGSAKVTISAVVGEETLTAEAITFTVEGASGPTYDIPDNAVEIKDAQSFLKVFDGAATYCNSNIYLSADIDLSAETLNEQCLMAGEFNGIFEGQGHTITGNINRGLFNFIGTEGVFRNVNIVTNQPIEANRGALAHTNMGTVSNVNVSMTIVEGRAGNVFAGLLYINNGTVSNSKVEMHVNSACNTVYSFACAAGGTYTSCTYSVDGTWDGASGAVIATQGTTLVE